MSVSFMLLMLSATPCTPAEKISLSWKEGTSMEALAEWSSKQLCVPTTVDASVGKGATLRVGVTGKVSASDARTMLIAAVSASGLLLMTEQNGALVISKPAPGSADDKVCEAAARALRPVSENERAVSKSVFESNWVDCTIASARIVPSMKDAQLNGVRLFSIRPTSVWAAAGFQNGDVLQEVNSMPLLEPAQIAEASTKLRHANRLEFLLERRGEPWRIIITIEADAKK